MVGFGYSAIVPPASATIRDAWGSRPLDLLDALSWSAPIWTAIRLAVRWPFGVDPRAAARAPLALMGSVGVFPDHAWDATRCGLSAVVREYARPAGSLPTAANWSMTNLRTRHEASIRPGFQESFAAMFPAPRQRWVNAMASAEADIRALPHETLDRGREDRIIPLKIPADLDAGIPKCATARFGHCGHWIPDRTQRSLQSLGRGFSPRPTAGTSSTFERLPMDKPKLERYGDEALYQALVRREAVAR